MEKKYNLTDIGNAIAKPMDNSMMRIIRSGAIGVLGIAHPVVGVTTGVVDNFLSEYDTYKLSLLLRGLSKELNIEMRLNELYNYVNSSSEKAISVANLFRKTVNAECPKVCFIYGLILANHMGSNTEFTQDELIICKALENATECDLKNFKEIMEKYIKPVENGNKIVFPKEFIDLDEFITTCDWGVYNRIFVSRMGEVDGGTLAIGPYYYEAKPASVLMEYIKKAYQIWDYRENI